MKGLFWSVVVVSAVGIIVPSVAVAAAVHIDDTAAGDTITITVNDFEGGFSVNGALIQIGLGNPASITLDEAQPLSFEGHWIDLGQSGSFTRTIYLVEGPLDPTRAPVISDILTYSVNSVPGQLATIVGRFVSDFENNLGTLPPTVDPKDVFVEDGRPVSFGAAFLSGEVLSDAEPRVPEPASLIVWSLLGAVGIGAGWWRRSQKA